MEQLVPETRREVAEFRKAHNDTKIGDVTVGMVRNYLYKLEAPIIVFTFYVLPTMINTDIYNT